MSITRISDVIQPEVFANYTIQRTMELSELIQSGIAVNTGDFDQYASGPNKLIHLPYWEDLSGDDEVMKDSGNIDAGKIEAAEDVARKLARVKSWGANGLSAYLSGDDPMEAIATRVADFWQRRYQQILLSILEGIFDSADMSDKEIDITSETGDNSLISGDTFLDALQKMGDAKDAISGVMMHSAVENYLAKNDLIDYDRPSEGSPRVPYFMDKRVIVDDAMTYDTSTKEGVAYLFGQGAVAWGNGSHPNIEDVEMYRNAQSYSGEDELITRRIMILHPRGVKWTEENLNEDAGDTTAGGSADEGAELPFPSNKALEQGENWEKVYDDKAIRVVRFEFKIA